MNQNQLDRKFCNRCQRNVFPKRPKPDYLLLFLSLFTCFLIFLVYYAFKSKDSCPICYSKVGMINFDYPPFKGTPESYDPNLISTGSVVRTEETIFEPEGDFVTFIPAPHNSGGDTDTLEQKFCKSCGSKIGLEMKFCTRCGVFQ